MSKYYLCLLSIDCKLLLTRELNSWRQDGIRMAKGFGQIGGCNSESEKVVVFFYLERVQLYLETIIQK